MCPRLLYDQLTAMRILHRLQQRRGRLLRQAMPELRQESPDTAPMPWSNETVMKGIKFREKSINKISQNIQRHTKWKYVNFLLFDFTASVGPPLQIKKK